MSTLTVEEIRERNVASVEALYASERRRDIDAWVPLWHVDGRQTFPLTPEAEVSGLARLIEVTREKFAVRPPYEIHVRSDPFADPSRVMARLRLVFSDGQPPADLWCIFHFDRAGLITEIEEIFDTARASVFPG